MPLLLTKEEPKQLVPKSREKLTKFLRLTIYNFLNIRDTIKVSRVSKNERQSMEESEIAKEGKSFVLNLDKDSRPQCLLHDDRVGKYVKQWRQ